MSRGYFAKLGAKGKSFAPSRRFLRGPILLGLGVLCGILISLAVVYAVTLTQSHTEFRNEIREIYSQAQAVGKDTRAGDEVLDHAILQLAHETGVDEGAVAQQLEQLADSGAHWENYRALVMNYRDALVSYVRAQVTEDEARQFYEDNPERFARQDIMELSVSVWRDGSVKETAEWTVTEDNIRELHERYDDIISASLRLHTGEDTLVERADGSVVQIHCVKRTSVGEYPFDEVRAAAAQQQAQQQVEELISARIEKLR